jgi:hypothetical protein
MRSGVVVLSLALASQGGCGFSTKSPAADGDASIPDSPEPDACTTFSTQLDTCALTLVDDITLAVGAYTYNTSTGELRLNGVVVPTRLRHMTLATHGGDVDAILVRNLHVPALTTFHAQGLLPLAIIASESITLDMNASIDVNDGGAGALSACSTQAKAGGNDPGGGGGGGGGGYSETGGNGSKGNAEATLAGLGASSITLPAGPQGGCFGAKGGDGNQGGDGGAGGAGGGALYLAAGSRIDLGTQAALLASGGGGHGGKEGSGLGDGGGGGGGSGGMIWLEAATVTTTQGVIAANGGGGGEGSSDTMPGNDGQPGSRSTSRATGGTGGADDGTDGGRGGSFESLTGENVTTSLAAGGGGGGGGVGYVVIVAANSQLGTVSPASRLPR